MSRELRADVDVQPVDVEPAARARARRLERVHRAEAELRAVVAGPDRFVRVGLDAGRDADERTPDARSGGALRLVRRVEHDERAGLRRGRELLVGLVVAVDDEPVAREPGRPRERELAERRDVRAEPLLGEQPQQRDVRERLRPVDDERVGCGRAVRACARPQRLLAVDDERRSELLRQRASPAARRAVSRAATQTEAPCGNSASIGAVKQLLP